jgi:hypothetical protein
MGTCWSCGKAIESNNYHRQDSCAHCGRDTHVCKNCDFHDRAYNNECRESSADRVVEKEKSNFCDFFNPSSRSGGRGGKTQDDLKAAAEALFKKKP